MCRSGRAPFGGRRIVPVSFANFPDSVWEIVGVGFRQGNVASFQCLSLLSPSVLEKVSLGHAFNKAAGIGGRLLDRFNVFKQWLIAHTGCGSRAPALGTSVEGRQGVSKSTRTPGSVSSSSCRLPRSNRVGDGRASTRISMSLPSLSVPWSTKPKTHGIASRGATDGFPHCV